MTVCLSHGREFMAQGICEACEYEQQTWKASESQFVKCNLCDKRGLELRSFLGGGAWCSGCAGQLGWSAREWAGLPLLQPAKH